MAVYTEVPDEELGTFIASYDIGEIVAFKGIAEGVENTNYLLQTSNGDAGAVRSYILTLYEKRVVRDDLPFFLGLLDHLAAAGISCPTPIKACDGEVLHELCGRPAAIVSFLAGLWPRRVQAHHCAALGAALAAMHIAGDSFAQKRANALALDGWDHLVTATVDEADTVEDGLAALIAAECVYLRNAWPADLPTGVIHGDLFPDNVFFRGKDLSGLIDFYFACIDFHAYDVAICLNAWCFEADGAFNITKAQQLLASYGRVRPFTRAEILALPILARGAALRFLLTRLYDWLNHDPAAFVSAKKPADFISRLRFHQGVAGPADYGLDWIGQAS